MTLPALLVGEGGCRTVMGVAAVLPWVFTAGWASGINPYLFALIAGVMGRLGFEGIPGALTRVDVLAVLAALAVVDFVASKIAYLDSVWDVVNTAIRPVAGAAFSVLFTAPDTPLMTAVVAGSGGVTALVVHFVKASVRLGVNSSPEPASNVVVSLVEDVAVATVAVLAVLNPVWAMVVAGIAFAVMLVFAVSTAVLVRRVWRKLRGSRGKEPSAAASEEAPPPSDP